jgi:hypothetical protein
MLILICFYLIYTITKKNIKNLELGGKEIKMLNQIMLVGKVRDIKKVKGNIESFKIDIPREGQSSVIDSPIIKVPSSLSYGLNDYMRDGVLVGVKGRIETVVRGGYGTVTTLVATRITYLSGGNK